MSVNIESPILLPFLILIYIYRKVKWKAVSWEMLICKEALLFQALGWILQLKIPSANFPKDSFLPTPHTALWHRGISQHLFDFRRKKRCTQGLDVTLICEALKVSQGSSHICPQDSSKVIYTVSSLALEFTHWLGKSVAVGKLANLTHLCSWLFIFLTSMTKKFPSYKI